jgi:hypothetical protein
MLADWHFVPGIAFTLVIVIGLIYFVLSTRAIPTALFLSTTSISLPDAAPCCWKAHILTLASLSCIQVSFPPSYDRLTTDLFCVSSTTHQSDVRSCHSDPPHLET